MLDAATVFARILNTLGAKNAPEAARKLGISKQAVYDWQKSPPGLENLLKISESTGASLHWILTGRGDQFVEVGGGATFDEIFEAKIRAIAREEIAAAATVQELGTIDEFLADSIRRHDDPSLVMQEWWAREGWPLEQLSVPDFRGWDALTLQQKIKEIKSQRDIIVRHIGRNEILTPRTPKPAS